MNNDLYNIYNEAYQSYLNNISPIIFMNTLLEKLINLLGCETGYIAKKQRILNSNNQ